MKNKTVSLLALVSVMVAVVFGCANPTSDDPADTSGNTPDTTAPANVTNVVVSVGDGQITLSWDQPLDADFAKVCITASGIGVEVPKGTATKAITGLANGTKYEFTLKSVDTAGNCSSGTSVSGTPVASGPAPVFLPVRIPSTAADIAGTWKARKTGSGKGYLGGDESVDYTFTYITTYSFDINGTWTKTCEYSYSSADPAINNTKRYEYLRGSYSLADGMIELEETECFESTAPCDIDGIAWKASDYLRGSTSIIRLIDGDLYIDAYIRDGGGTGIQGTWTGTGSDWRDSSGVVKTDYSKVVITIADGKETREAYHSSTGDFPDDPELVLEMTVSDNGDGTAIQVYEGVEYPCVYGETVMAELSCGYTKQE